MSAFEKPTLEIADIFNQFSHLLGPMPPHVWKVVQAIQNCRTSVLGGHKKKCDSCDHVKNAYNSCRNRHCPKCQFVARAIWMEAREQDLLPCQYFHVVFTIPAELQTGTSDWLFVPTKNSHDGQLEKKLSHTALGYIIRVAAKAAGVKKTSHPMFSAIPSPSI